MRKSAYTVKQAGKERGKMPPDRKEAAEKISAELGLDGFSAGLLPDGKLKEFNEIKKTFAYQRQTQAY